MAAALRSPPQASPSGNNEAERTGVAISIHPTPNDESVLEIVEILLDAGANLHHTMIGHVDVSGFCRETCRRLAGAGCYLGYDNFGLEGLLELPGLGRAVDLRDTQRIDQISGLIEDGYLDRIVISQDVATKHRLASYGGLGYAHILRDIVPLMIDRGFEDEHIHALLVENPGRALTFCL